MYMYYNRVAMKYVHTVDEYLSKNEILLGIIKQLFNVET